MHLTTLAVWSVFAANEFRRVDVLVIASHDAHFFISRLV